MNEFLNAVQNRRTIYTISNETTITDTKLKEILETAINHTPSAFNSQSSRVVLLLGDEHKKLWNITLTKLKVIIPPENFAATQEKIESFAAGYGTVLYFEEQETIENLQKSYPTYANNFPTWSQQGSGMLQFVVWTALEIEGLGASLQHYNPLIDEDVASTWVLPKTWKLISQMPFGKPTAPAPEKAFFPIKSRFKSFGSK